MGMALYFVSLGICHCFLCYFTSKSAVLAKISNEKWERQEKRKREKERKCISGRCANSVNTEVEAISIAHDQDLWLTHSPILGHS